MRCPGPYFTCGWPRPCPSPPAPCTAALGQARVGVGGLRQLWDPGKGAEVGTCLVWVSSDVLASHPHFCVELGHCICNSVSIS